MTPNTRTWIILTFLALIYFSLGVGVGLCLGRMK
jgi:hypothetical protein